MPRPMPAAGSAHRAFLLPAKIAIDKAVKIKTVLCGPSPRRPARPGDETVVQPRGIEADPMLRTPPISATLPVGVVSAMVRACRLAAIVVCVFAWPGPLAAQDLTGKPLVIDGNTIEIAGQPIRLFGIQAPGRDEACGAGEAAWPCGANAAFALARIIGSNWVSCFERRRTDWAVVAVCHAAGPAGPDINARMIADGWARAASDAPSAYRAHERRARTDATGIWGRPAVPSPR